MLERPIYQSERTRSRWEVRIVQKFRHQRETRENVDVRMVQRPRELTEGPRDH